MLEINKISIKSVKDEINLLSYKWIMDFIPRFGIQEYYRVGEFFESNYKYGFMDYLKHLIIFHLGPEPTVYHRNRKRQIWRKNC